MFCELTFIFIDDVIILSLLAANKYVCWLVGKRIVENFGHPTSDKKIKSKNGVVSTATNSIKCTSSSSSSSSN